MSPCNGEILPRPNCDDPDVVPVSDEEDEENSLNCFIVTLLGLNPASSCPIAFGRILHFAQ